jgi:hypothetical protein
MKCGSQIAVAVVGGYLLGRSRKTRLAALLALLAAGGKLPIDQRELLRHTPLGGPLEKLTGDLRSQVVDAGLSVAKKAASNRIDSFSDKLQQRAESLRTPGVRRPGEPAEAEEEPEAPARPSRERREPSQRRRERAEPVRRERTREEPVRRERGREPDDYAEEDEYEEYEDDYERDDREPDDYADDEYADEDYADDDYAGDEPEPEPEPGYRERRPPARRTAGEPRRRAPRREDDRPTRGRAAR